VRNLILLTCTLAGAAGCSGSASSITPVANRDLTLPVETSTAPVQPVASPVELRRPQRVATHSARKTSRPPLREPDIIPVAFSPAPVLPVTASQPVPPPSQKLVQPVDEHELPPGKTVTVIPASSGPTLGSGPDEPSTSATPKVRRSRGGTCHGH
jgi:hypothetical protein